MPLDPSIPLSGRPMRRLDPVAKLGDLLQLQVLRGAMQDREEARSTRAAGQDAARARETILRQLFSRDQPPTEQEVRNSDLSFDDSQTVIKMIQAMTDEQRVKRLKDWEITRDIFGGLKLFDPATRDQIWQQAVGRGREMGIAGIPDQFDESWLNMATTYGQMPREAPRPTLVGPEGGTFVDPTSGQPLSTIEPTKPPRTPTVGSFEDYVTQRFGPRPTPDQIAQARQTWMAQGREPPVETDQALPSAYRTGLDRAILNIPATRRRPIIQLANRLWQEGNEAELQRVIQQAAIDTENVDMKNQILGRKATIALLEETKTILEEMKRQGVPTNWFRGTAEDLARRAGISTNPPAYVMLGNRLMGTLIQYRRTATGIQFSEIESRDYQRMFPNYRNTLPVNLALIEGLTQEMRSYDQTYWKNKLGPDWATLTGQQTPAPPAQPTTDELDWIPGQGAVPRRGR